MVRRRTIRGQMLSAVDDLPGLHPDKFVGHAFQQRGLVSDYKNGLAGVAHTFEQAHHLPRRVHIDVGKRFIQQQYFGIVQNGARQRHALPHALRILSHGPRQLGIEPHGANRLLTAAVASDVVEAGDVAQVFHAAHLVVQQGRVGHVADVAAGLVRGPAQDGNRAARGMRQPGQRAQQSGLPCPVVAEDDVELARVKVRGDPAQCGEPAELFDQIAYAHLRRFRSSAFSHNHAMRIYSFSR